MPAERATRRSGVKLDIMIIKLFFFFIANTSFYCSFSQNSNRCDLLESILKSDKARKVFLFDKHKDFPIRFIDVKLLLPECNIASYYDRKVTVVHDSLYKTTENYSDYLITNIVKTKKGFEVSIFFKVTNALFTAELKRKQHKFIVSKFSGGYF